uniref:Odorant receptor n=1 Tax=Tetranychus urticae TaxID=32264 RepID=A0A158P5D5_TETUR
MEMKIIADSTESSVQKNYFLKDLANLFRYSFVTPDHNKVDLCSAQLVQRTERLTIIFQVLRNGLNQNNSIDVNRFGYRRYNWLDWTIGITSLINWFRCIVLICTSSETLAICLGDPLFRSKDRQIIILCALTILLTMIIFREWILNLEAKGNLEIFSIWKCCRNGFDPVHLQMNNVNIKRFRLIVICVSIVAYCTMLVAPLFLSVGFFTVILCNPWIFEIPELAFYCFLWSLSEIFIASFLLNSILGFSWYLLCTLSFHLYRLMHLLNTADYLINSTKGALNERKIKLFSLIIIRRLNSFESTARKLRYVLFYYVFVFASSGDVYIFLGIIVRVYNDFLADLIVALLGIFILPSIGVFGLIFGNFISELDKLTVRLHQLALNNRLSLNTSSKVLEVMNRVAGPYNGIKLGDFLTIEKSFFIFFILENISTLMLFTVNIGPLIN